MNFAFNKNLQEYINILYNSNLSDHVLRKCDLYIPTTKYITQELVEITYQFDEFVNKNYKDATVWHFSTPDDTIVLFVGDLNSIEEKIYAII